MHGQAALDGKVSCCSSTAVVVDAVCRVPGGEGLLVVGVLVVGVLVVGVLVGAVLVVDVPVTSDTAIGPPASSSRRARGPRSSRPKRTTGRPWAPEVSSKRVARA